MYSGIKQKRVLHFFTSPDIKNTCKDRELEIHGDSPALVGRGDLRKHSQNPLQDAIISISFSVRSGILSFPCKTIQNIYISQVYLHVLKHSQPFTQNMAFVGNPCAIHNYIKAVKNRRCLRFLFWTWERSSSAVFSQSAFF